jgi:hypothetical protein
MQREQKNKSYLVVRMSRLAITWCLLCNRNPISESTFPHYCASCVDLIRSGDYRTVSVMFQEKIEEGVD